MHNLKSYKRVKTSTILQMEVSECGAASLAMIMAYYDKYVPLESLRQECNVTRDGIKAKNILIAARKFGFEAKGKKKEPEDLKYIKPPMIIHWNFNHFVVFEGYRNGYAYINDPAIGRRKITLKEMDESFTGVVLTFEPSKEFKKSGQPINVKLSIKNRLENSKSALYFLLLIGLLLVIPGIIVPSFSTIFIDEIFIGGKDYWLTPLLIAMSLVGVLKLILRFMQKRFLIKMEAKLATTGSAGFFWHMLRVSVSFFQQRSVGDISTRMSSNNTIASFIARELTISIIGIVVMVFYFIVMLQYSVPLTLISLLLAFVNAGYFIYSSKKIEDLNTKALQDNSKLYGFSVSGIRIIESIKSTGQESGFFSKWTGYHSKQYEGQQKIGETGQVLYALPNCIKGLADAMVLCIGGFQIMQGNLTLGSLVAFQGLLSSFMRPVTDLTNMGIKIKKLKGEMIRLDDVVNYDIDKYNDPECDINNDEAYDENSFRKLEGYLEVKDLSFGYGSLDEPLIENFNLKLKPGSRVALVGGSGSGKSTIAKIIAGIYQPWSGEILFDGVSRNSLPRNVINNSFAVVDQDISIFEGTITDNITMWDNTINESDVIQAAKDACIHDDISKKDNGYQYYMREDGTNFSGGQRQRIEISRALIKNPTILIMDEATSALDVVTEQKVNDNISSRGCTCIIVAHRLSTIRDCDEIIVMKKGKIVQRGTHDELKSVEGEYASLVSSL